MLSRSDLNTVRAEVAEIAQLLRGHCAFGSVAFSEHASDDRVSTHIEPGYEDCLPILGGGCWRDPQSPPMQESVK